MAETTEETFRPTAIINGIRYKVLAERDGKIQVCRPNGTKVSWAVRLPDSPLYGENRARIDELLTWQMRQR